MAQRIPLGGRTISRFKSLADSEVYLEIPLKASHGATAFIFNWPFTQGGLTSLKEIVC
jgi:hypothetical protein